MPSRVQGSAPLAALAARISSNNQALHNTPLAIVNSKALTWSPNSYRYFSNSTCLCARKRVTRLRRDFYAWLNTQGVNFRVPLPGSTNYLTHYNASGQRIQKDGKEAGAEGKAAGPPPDNRPFPLNYHFKSLPILSEELRQAIYDKVQKQSRSVRDVSVETKVSMERVGAVVRLKEVERLWNEEGKRMAIPYAKAVQDMIPQTPWNPRRPVTHEPINDLPVHPATTLQIFHPTSESRAFTREDAARVFDPRMLTADRRIPHPQLIMEERMRDEAWTPDQKRQYYKEQRTRDDKSRAEEEERKLKKQALTKVVGGRRWDFRFKDVTVTPQSVGVKGRGASGIGWRYGFPHEDRKKGQIKIPTRVD